MNDIKDMNILFCDVETGGLDPNLHSLLQIGMAAYKQGIIVDTLNIFLKEDSYVVTPQALEVNKLNLTEVQKNGVPAEIAISQIIDFIIKNFNQTKPIFAGHNVTFDKQFISVLFKRLNENIENYISYRMIDTMSLIWGLAAAGKYPLESCSSAKAFEYFGIKVERLHDGLEDALATAKLFEKIIEKIKG